MVRASNAPTWLANQQLDRASIVVRFLSTISYTLLCGAFGIVLIGSIYVMFFVPESQVSPGSLHSDSPLSEKLSHTAFLLVAFAVGLVVNRMVWSRLKRL
jgi:hypothetical protein